MSAEERRAEIVRATVPLVSEHGAKVTTRQIAEAAGIAEGTVFRVFTDKDELVGACVAEVFRTDVIAARVRETTPDTPLEEQLVEAGLLLAEHFSRLGDLMHALAASGYNVHEHKPAEVHRDGPAAFMREVEDAVVQVLDRERDRFRLPARDIGRMFLGLLFSLRFDPRPPSQRRAVLRQHVDVLLHGALA